ncbi:cell wall hydrolase [Vallitalea pronyensis]|uniref:Cell wall hydrolase n=1 Tax=Vallitalea pronyensis TaxID=1348613 RepID=A0A8J8MJ93_9FIRM|nr:cell wall hydrolase [Vallitalea pronyensis]QUI22847.1 cell wall hydrolase [Vallitalea pronyensis]
MFKVKNLLKDLFLSLKHISKKAYTSGLIIVTGCMVLAIVYMGVNGFAGTEANAVAALGRNVEEETAVSDSKSVEEEDGIAELELEISRYKAYKAEANQQATNGIKAEALTPMKAPEEESDERVMHTASFKAEEQASKLVSLSAKDYEALTRIVEAEATDEDIKGKILIVNVVMNRVKSSKFPNNIYDVIHQRIKGRVQFSPISDGRYYKLSVTNSTKKALEQAFNGEDYSKGALYFMARSLASSKAVSWFDNNLTKVTQHGAHEFFK